MTQPTETIATEKQPGLVTVHDLYQVVKLLEDLATMKRLSTAEIEHVKPAFDNIVSFLAEYEKGQQAAAAQTETNLLDLSETPTEKPVAKKKTAAKGKK